MNGYVANTDYDWYRFLRDRPDLEEVNFWQPSGGKGFHVVPPGAPFFFKLKSPHYAIGGFGFFSLASREPPLSVAWDAFGERNGAATLDEMRTRVLKYRREKPRPGVDPGIGCLMVSSPVFFEQDEWVRQPSDWSRYIVQGKGYDLTQGEGERIWNECRDRASAVDLSSQPESSDAEPRYGTERTIRPRLGQGAFRVAVLDAYGRSCAVTTEHSVPVLESAHIRPYAEGGPHDVANGLLLRADIHRLFDAGFVTVTPDLKFRVSDKLRESWQNGRVYYALNDRPIHVPERADRPSREHLEWHGDTRFRG